MTCDKTIVGDDFAESARPQVSPRYFSRWKTDINSTAFSTERHALVHYLPSMHGQTPGRLPLIRSISQIADSSRMRNTWPPHNLVGGIYRATLIHSIKYSLAGTRYTVFVVNGNPGLDTQRGSTPRRGEKGIRSRDFSRNETDEVTDATRWQTLKKIRNVIACLRKISSPFIKRFNHFASLLPSCAYSLRLEHRRRC